MGQIAVFLKHEDGHKEIFQNGLNKLVEDINKLSNPTADEFESLYKKSTQMIQKKHNDYDTKTENGSARGVEMVIE